MGKHTQRQPGHLPEVAPGAAPLALLLAGLATAPATTIPPTDGPPPATDRPVGNSLTAVTSANGFSPAPPRGAGQFRGDLFGGIGTHRPSRTGIGAFAGSLDDAELPTADLGPAPDHFGAAQSLPANAFRGELSLTDLAPPACPVSPRREAAPAFEMPMELA